MYVSTLVLMHYFILSFYFILSRRENVTCQHFHTPKIDNSIIFATGDPDNYVIYLLMVI